MKIQFYIFIISFKLCYAYGQKTMMVPKSGESNTNALSAVVKYLWAGYVLECPRHGTIYRSRGYWSGNVEPEMNPQVHWEIVHVWQGEKSILSVNYFSQFNICSTNS